MAITSVFNQLQLCAIWCNSRRTDYESVAENPTSRASVCQCRGCGMRRPLRMSVAYGSDTRRADAKATTVTTDNCPIGLF